MKYIALLFLLCSFRQEEPLFVLTTKGTVINLSTNKVLKTGDRIYDNTKLQYNAAEDYVEVVSFKRGRGRVYWNTTHGPQKKASWVGTVKDYFVPATQIKALLSRNATFNSLEELGSYISELTIQGNHPLLIIQAINIPLHPKFYADRNTYFFYTRSMEGADTVNRKLVFPALADSLNVGWLRFDENCCKLQPDSLPPVKTTLYYYDAREGRSFPVTDNLSFVYKRNSELIPEVRLLREQLEQANKSKEWVEDEVAAYLLANYGAAPRGEVKKLIQAAR